MQEKSNIYLNISVVGTSKSNGLKQELRKSVPSVTCTCMYTFKVQNMVYRNWFETISVNSDAHAHGNHHQKRGCGLQIVFSGQIEAFRDVQCTSDVSWCKTKHHLRNSHQTTLFHHPPLESSSIGQDFIAFTTDLILDWRILFLNTALISPVNLGAI